MRVNDRRRFYANFSPAHRETTQRTHVSSSAANSYSVLPSTAKHTDASFSKNSPTADLTDMLRKVSEYSMKCPTSLCDAMVVLSLFKKAQIGNTQYADNAVYVDDVDADEAGAGAYFFAQTQRCSHQL